MYAIDFEYDGQYLSDYGFIICHFDASTGANFADAGSKITFNKVSRINGKSYSLTSTKYAECIQTTFDICKNPDLYDYENREISNDEYRDIMRWLNRREFLKFQVINDEDNNFERDTCYYNASFNIDKIKINEKLYGMRLTMETDKPFGYGQEFREEWTITNASESKLLIDVSDEIGYTYPNMKIICHSDGDLSIINKATDCTMVIKNCSKGEIITIEGDELIIYTSNKSHDICNDFNYEFFRIGNTYKNRDNIITVSIPCQVIISYAPIIKDIP